MRSVLLILVVAVWGAAAAALEPAEILVIVNKNCPNSVNVGNYYCLRRNVPKANIVSLDLKWPDDESISRTSYDHLIAEPVRAAIRTGPYAGKIRCLLTTYGVPIKVGGRNASGQQALEIKQLESMLNEKKAHLASILSQLKLLGTGEAPTGQSSQPSVQTMLAEIDKCSHSAIQRIRPMPEGKQRTAAYLRWLGYYETVEGKVAAARMALTYGDLSQPILSNEQDVQLDAARSHLAIVNNAQRENWTLSQRLDKGFYGSLEQATGLKGVLEHLQSEIDTLNGKESGAAVDSELSMLQFENYELSGYQKNELKERVFWVDVRTLMVSRLDGPDPTIAKLLVDKAMLAEKTGVKGKAYFDARGLTMPGKEITGYTPYDKYILEAADYVRDRTKWQVQTDNNDAVFGPGACPETALYCGWYSLAKYVPSFTFEPGAVGYHVASYEAIHLRNSATHEWCANLLLSGITVTLGPVAEPYLTAFPNPRDFFAEILDGTCLVEAYYKTLPYNSWQMILIGDPLYRFKIRTQ